MEQIYVFPDIADKVAAMLRTRHAGGEYASISSAKEFSELVTKQMREIAHDAHLRVAYNAQVLPAFPGPNSDSAEPPPEMLARMRRDNYAFQEVRVLDGNVGYLKFHGFMDAARGGDTVA